MAVKIQEGRIIDWINNTGSEVANKSVIDLGTRIGVSQTVIEDGDVGAVELVGVYEEVAATADAVAVGNQLYWDGTQLTTAADDGADTNYTPAGMAVTSKAGSVAGSVNVRIG